VVINCKSLVITMQHKIFGNKIMSPLIQSLNYCIELFIMCGILLLEIIHLLTEISNRFVFLTQYCSKCYSIASHFTWKIFIKYGRTRIGCSIILAFNALNPFSTYSIQLKDFFSFFMVSSIGAQILLKFFILPIKTC